MLASEGSAGLSMKHCALQVCRKSRSFQLTSFLYSFFNFVLVLTTGSYAVSASASRLQGVFRLISDGCSSDSGGVGVAEY